MTIWAQKKLCCAVYQCEWIKLYSIDECTFVENESKSKIEWRQGSYHHGISPIRLHSLRNRCVTSSSSDWNIISMMWLHRTTKVKQDQPNYSLWMSLRLLLKLLISERPFVCVIRSHEREREKREMSCERRQHKNIFSDAHIDVTALTVNHEQINVPRIRARWNSHIHSHTLWNHKNCVHTDIKFQMNRIE